MVNRMIASNVLHRPVRTLISVLAVAIEVGMVLLVVGMTTGLVDDSKRRVEGVGGDVLVRPPGSSFMLGLTSAPMPIKIGDRLTQVSHVLAVAPALLQVHLSSRQGGMNVIYGIDMPSFTRVSGGFAYYDGGPLAGPDDILVDDWFAKAYHLKVGDTLNLSHDFHVVGIVQHGKGARLFIPLATAQDLWGAHDKASIFFVKCTDPGYADEVVNSIRELLPRGYQVLSIQEYMSLMTSDNLPAFNAFVRTMIGVAVTIGFLVIFLSMYTTITERTREIGILKSLGASKGYIIGLILREACLLSLFGIVAGYGGTLMAKRVIVSSFPTLPVELTARWAAFAALIAVTGTLLGAFYPALRAARLDPIDALAYE